MSSTVQTVFDEHHCALNPLGRSGFEVSLPYAEKYGLASLCEKVELPGHGSPGPTCGKKKAITCLKCGRSFIAEHQCGDRECPSCYEKWAYRQGRIDAHRLWIGARLISRARSRTYYRIVHAVVSVPVTKDWGYPRLRSEVYRILKERGFDMGGLTVAHFGRQDEKTNTFYADGFIHFHCFVTASSGITPIGKNEDNVVFKVIRDKEHGDYKGFRNPVGLARAIGYTLTHCGILERRHAMTWFGPMSYNQMSDATIQMVSQQGWDEVHKKLRNKCPYCGSFDTMQTGEYLADGTLDPGWIGENQWRLNRSNDRQEMRM